jgi:hypothetical protein
MRSAMLLSSHRFGRRLAAAGWLALALAIGSPAFAVPVVPPAPPEESAAALTPTFYIESIEVVGLERAQPEVVVAESLLTPNSELGESQLGDAIARIRRLPFVLEASFALRKGSARGRYRLEISVVETRRFFFGEDAVVTQFSNFVAFDNLLAERRSLSPNGLAGIRFFPGRYTLVFASVSGTGLQAGLTRYNLFDRRIFLSAGIQAHRCCPVQTFSLGLDPTFSSYKNEDDLFQATLTMGMPLRGNNSLRLQISRSEAEEGERRNLLGVGVQRAGLAYRDLMQQRVELAWVFDTSDDPILPSEGLTFTTALDAQELNAHMSELFPFVFLPGPTVVPDPDVPAKLPRYEARQVRLSMSLAQHWPLSERQVVSASARLGVGIGEVENLPVLGQPVNNQARLSLVDEENLSLAESHFTLRYSLALWNATRTREWGDFRWETGVEFGYDRTRPQLDLPDNPLYRKSVMTSLVFRNGWGIFRFTFQIANYGRGF